MYMKLRGEIRYMDTTLEETDDGKMKMRLPYWWLMGGMDNFRVVPRRWNDRLMMQPYRSMIFPREGHIESHHVQKPFRRLRK